MNMRHFDHLSSFILLWLVDTFPSISVSQHAPRLNPSSMVACHRIFRAFQKPTHPKGKATHTHWAHNLPKQNAWTGWHDPACYTNHPSPTSPVLLITHTTTHGDTHAGCGTYDHRKWRTAFCWPYSSRYQWRCNLEVTSRRRQTKLLSFPPSSPESSSQNLCQGELIAFVALSLSGAGRNNEVPANSRPLTITLTPWQWYFDFILNTLLQHTSGQDNHF